ncbi:MAG: hypothetical protein L0Y70_06180 [Gemmataceae bacterium]|nr:hypothetical protein [Gemmataceae bacterium]
MLRTSASLPAGAKVRCTQCQTVFATAAAPVPVGAAASNNHTAQKVLTSKPAPVHAPVASQPLAAIASPETDATADDHRGKRVLFVLTGVLAVIGLAVVLVVVCLQGDGPGVVPNEPGGGGYVDLPIEPFVPKAPAPPPPLIPLSKEDEAKVAELVKKGAEWLKKTQHPSGTWGPAGQALNYVGLGGLTLLECGTSASDPSVQKAAKFVRDNMPKLHRTYEMSLCLLFLDRLGDKQDLPHIETLAMRLVAGQLANGAWTYNQNRLTDSDVPVLRGLLQDAARISPREYLNKNKDAASKLSMQARKAGVFTSPDNAPANVFAGGGGDNSNTQFAILALWAARRHKLPVDPALELVVRRFRSTQNPDGSFPYSPGLPMASQNGLPTMTCAGLLGLAVGYGIAADGKTAGPGPNQDPAIQKALRHLSASIGDPPKDAKQQAPVTELYFLWSIERVAVLYQLSKIAGKDWFHWGLWMLAQHQRPNGQWHFAKGHGHSPLVDTCFALLFLQRANLAKDLTDKLTEVEFASAPALPGRKN